MVQWPWGAGVVGVTMHGVVLIPLRCVSGNSLAAVIACD